MLFLYMKVALGTLFTRSYSLKEWLGFLWRFVVGLLGVILFPAQFLLIPYPKLLAFNYLLGESYLLLVWVYIYLAGVFVLRYLLRWLEGRKTKE